MSLYISKLKSQERIISVLNRKIEVLSGISNKYSTYRLIVFITGAAISVAAYFISNLTGWIFTLISVAAFSVVVHMHNKLLEGIRKFYTYMKIKEENLARMKVDWNNIPDPILNTPPTEMTTEKDLDLTGKYSLHNLLDTAVSKEGSALLRKWISNYLPDEKEILERQKIIKELSGLERFRDRFLLKSRLISKKHLDCERIIRWTKSSVATELPGWIFPVAIVLIAGYIILFILSSIDLIPSYWILLFGIYFLIYSANQKKIGKIIEESAELENQLKKLTSLIVYAEKYSFEKYEHLSKFTELFRDSEISAAGQLLQLKKITSALLIRENPVIRLIVNILFPFDIFYSMKLSAVKNSISSHIENWTEKFNQLECYISLSNFACLNPDYVFPELAASDEGIFDSVSLGHPLIKREFKVCNDFSFEKKNEIVIITGSNMSGKSTFLRTAGINLCLAYSGAPVNAVSFRTSLFELFTCIKVSDSVTDGISYFYAEVTRLKQLLDEFGNMNSLSKFFLIDEIFKGTNNKERLTGSRAFIRRLSELKGTGFISTHDLELVNLSGEIGSIVNYHFREEIIGNKMEFDYKIHPGPCPTTNALKIMELSGLPV